LKSLEINELRERYAVERDDREFSLGDTLDVKTSVILLVVVFLAEQSSHFFESPLTRSEWWMQFVSVASLIVAGIFAVLELCPRDYGTEGSPTRYDEWIEKLKTYYSESDNPDSLVFEQAIKGRAERARERAELNIVANKKKSMFLRVAFWFTVASFSINLATLAMRLF